MIYNKQMPSYKNLSLLFSKLKPMWHNCKKLIMSKYKMMFVIYNKRIKYKEMK